MGNNDTVPGIYIRYVGHLIKEIDYPTGLQKQFNYNCTDAMKVHIYNSLAKHHACAVSEETVNPSAGQPPVTVSYQYSQVNANDHNYLAFNAGLSVVNSTMNGEIEFSPENRQIFEQAVIEYLRLLRSKLEKLNVGGCIYHHAPTLTK